MKRKVTHCSAGSYRTRSTRPARLALRRAGGAVARQMIEALEARQLLSIAPTSPATASPRMHRDIVSPQDLQASTTTLATSTPFSDFGQSVTLTAAVTSGATGNVSFVDGTTILATVALNGSQTTFTTSALPVGSHSITAQYAGDSTYAAGTSAALTQTVTKTAASVAVSSSTPVTPTASPIVTPTHIVVVVEEDRYAGAIGDIVDMPYINSLAGSGLVYSNTQGLNNVSQEGQMSYLGLYSGDTQGVTDNGNYPTFTGPNLAQSLANQGLSFSGYAEGLPYAGDTTDTAASDPNNPAYTDLYQRIYDPMAQFSNVGTGITNASVNQPFTSFPTTAAGYVALPTVSFVIPDTLHNTHGSNETDPFATDPAAYDLLRNNADTWLQQNIDGYLQWAKQNNSLLIITGDEGDRAHDFANGFATLVNGSTNLFTTGVDATPLNEYNLLRTIEDMYGLPKLGNSATAADLDTNLQGKLGAPQNAGASVVGQSVTFNASVSSVAPGAGTPTGTVQFVVDGSNYGSPAALSNGLASSPSVTFLANAGHTVSAIYTSDTNFSAGQSSSLAQTVDSAATSIALSSSAPSTVWGQSVRLTATVSAVAPGLGIPTGSVIFFDGATSLGPAWLGGSGRASIRTSSLTVSSHSITAVYGSDANYAGSTSSTFTQNVAQASTTTAVVSSANPSVAGQSISFTATVTANAPGAGTPIGSVTFTDGAMTLGIISLNGSGQAVFTTSALTLTPHSITASYSGDPNFTASASTALSQSVLNDSSTTALASSTNPSVAGQSVTFTATVTANSPGSGTPTGNVTFSDGATTLGMVALNSSGVATFTTSDLTVASHSITASYAGDSNFATSASSSVNQSVTNDASTTALVSTINPSVFGQSVAFTATVTANAPGAGTPTGNVIFSDGATTLGVVALNGSGVATFTTSDLTVASHSITASYVGDSNFATSASASLNQSVAKDASTTALVSAINPSVFGQSVAFTATVTANAPGAGTPTGNVTFLDGATTLGVVALNGSGVAVFTTSSLSVATHSITASYAGDGNFLTSTSSAVSETVNPVPVVNFPTGFTGATGLQLNGSSTVVGSVLQLTSLSPTYQIASTFTSSPVDISSFTTSFDFQLSAGANTAHGFTFCIQGQGPTAMGREGGGLGYGNDYATGASVVTKSIAIKFDLYSNEGEGPNSTGLFTNGANPTLNATNKDLTSSGINLHSGDKMNVQMTYNGTTLTVIIKDTVTGATATQDYTVDIPSFVGGPDGYVGFTAGTGGLTAVQKILDWTFNSASTTSATSTTLASSANPSSNGQSVTFTATVTSAGGTPAGNVTFSDGATVLGTGALNASGVATFTTSTLSTASHSITAVYAGNSSFATSTSSALIQNVTASTSTALSSSLNPSTSGQSVTFTATVTSAGGIPSGNVTFSDGATVLGTVALNGSGVATFTTSSLSTASHSITASYAGNSSFAASTSSALLQNVTASTSTALTSSLNPSGAGQSVTFTATVTSAGGTPIGNVTFSDGATVLGTVALNGSGVATFSTSALSVASHSITAAYAGNGSFQPSTSTTLTQNVLAATSTALTTSLNPANAGQSVTFTATVTSTVGTPGGNVTFFDGATALATVALNASRVATFTTSSLNVASHTITASYAGNTTFAASTSSAIMENITAGTTTAVTSSLNPSTFGQSITFTATVTSAGGTPAGSVTFTDGVTSLGTVALNASGVASFTISTLATAHHSITASYAGNGSFGASTSAALIQNVTASTTTALTSSLNPSTSGQSVTFTATVTSAGGMPGGNVTFSDGATMLGMVAVNASGVATFTTSALSIVSHSITASYAGNGSFAASTSSTLTQVVNSSSTPAVNFPNGFRGATGLQLNGSSTINGSAVQLTSLTPTYQIASAFTSTKVNIASFTTSFDFQLTAGSTTGHGFTFCIQGQGATAMGREGGGLGYGNDYTTGASVVTKSIAIKFDLYNNEGEGPNSTGLFTNGANPTLNATNKDLTSSGIDLHSGNKMNVKMTYSGTTLTVIIKDTVTGATATQTYSINIQNFVGGTSAYVGFTAGTGGRTAVQSILDWTLTNS